MPINVKAQPALSSTKKVKTTKDDDDEESLVRQVIAENPLEEVGVREEWQQQIGWHHKENIWVSPNDPRLMNRKQQPKQQLRGTTVKLSPITHLESHLHTAAKDVANVVVSDTAASRPLSLSGGSHSRVDRVTGGSFFLLLFACILSFWCRGRPSRCRCGEDHHGKLRSV